MINVKKDVRLNEQEYLDAELISDVKHEYYNGYVTAMVGASRNHNIIAGNLFARIHQHLKGSDCHSYISDMKVHIVTNENRIFYYPDVMVSCDKNPPSEYYEVKPIVIIEVLSQSTEAYDKRTKLAHYLTIPTLKEFVIVAQDQMSIDQYTVNKEMTLTEYRDTNDIINFHSIGLALMLKEIYEEVNFLEVNGSGDN